MWKLGGKHSSFKMGSGTNFEWQHDATLQGGGVLTLFDDAASPEEEPQSRALKIHLGNHRATLIHAYTHKPPLVANNEGSMQLLPNHNVFVDWGAGNDPRHPNVRFTHFFSEYTPSGRSDLQRRIPTAHRVIPRLPPALDGPPALGAEDRGKENLNAQQVQRVRELERGDPGGWVAGARGTDEDRSIQAAEDRFVVQL